MQIALAQINPVVGDFRYNAEKIVAAAAEAKAKGCGLVVLPELALCGYPPQDLLERDAFLADHDAVLAELVSRIYGIGVICGVIGHHTGPSGKLLHNCAVLFEDGKVLFTARKRLLPTYDVFDESRYFEPGRTSELFVYKDLLLALTICEDIWNDRDVFPRQLYPCDPVAEMVAAARSTGRDIDLLINLSASPFHRGKIRQKQQIFSWLCAKHRLPLVYVNQVGGQDSLLFDGSSMAFDKKGALIARGYSFQEDLLVLATDTWQGELRPCPAGGDPASGEVATVLAGLIMGVRDYVGKCGFRRVVIGLSGGIDSALTAAIACQALGAENVMGVALPSPYTSAESIADARALARNLGCRFETIPITPLFETFLATLKPVFTGWPIDVTEQNIQARIRGNLLMALSNKFQSLLLSTGNKSEMAVGYCTLYGDMSGGLAVIADVPKLLVYELARHVNRDQAIIPQRIIDRPPSAELAPNQLDQDDLPPYEILDPILTAYLEESQGIEAIVGQGFDRSIVTDVVRRINRNEYKRKQAPLGLKVTTKSFGYGRRYPTAQNYQEGRTTDDLNNPGR
jgi:NAD+ synthase (glutamine-hydrolysing)